MSMHGDSSQREQLSTSDDECACRMANICARFGLSCTHAGACRVMSLSRRTHISFAISHKYEAEHGHTSVLASVFILVLVDAPAPLLNFVAPSAHDCLSSCHPEAGSKHYTTRRVLIQRPVAPPTRLPNSAPTLMCILIFCV